MITAMWRGTAAKADRGGRDSGVGGAEFALVISFLPWILNRQAEQN
jgi:hypothetical protein